MGKLLLAALLLFSLVLAGCGGEKQAEGSDEQAGVSNIRQLVTADNASSGTLMWQGETGGEYFAEYRLKGGNMQRLPAKDVTFTDNGSRYSQYLAKLTDLQPGKEYEYRIARAGVAGSWHKLQLDQGTEFTALVFPDSQSSDYSGWQKLAQDAAKRHSEAKMFINMGDLVDNGSDQRQWQEWFKGTAPFSADKLFAPVCGNHETYTMDWKLRMPDVYKQLFVLPENGFAEYQNQFYSFDYGPVHFTVLDTQFAEEKEWQPQLLQHQLQWLRKDLAKSKARWKIILMHKDVLLYGFNTRAGTATHFIDVGEAFMPVFEEYGVDAVLSAHLHTYRRRVPLRDFVPTQDGITYVLTGVAGSVRYPDLWQDSELDAARAPQPETANYMTLRASDNELELKAYLPDGTQFDAVKLTK